MRIERCNICGQPITEKGMSYHKKTDSGLIIDFDLCEACSITTVENFKYICKINPVVKALYTKPIETIDNNTKLN